MSEIHTIATHWRAHFDELFAIYLLKKYGGPCFPGISAAKIEFSRERPTKSAKAYEAEGILLVGFGGGDFDEHATLERAARENTCAALLVMDYLDLEGERSLNGLFKYALEQDRGASSSAFDIARVVKLLHAQFPEDPMKVYEWTAMAIETHRHDQEQFHGATQDDFRVNARVEEIPNHRGRPIVLAFSKTGSEQFSRFARSPFGGRADVVIQQTPEGRIGIFTNQRREPKVFLYDLAQMVRLEEQRKRRILRTTRFEDLRRDGAVPGAEMWHFQEEAQALMNGSLTAPDVEPTKLTLEEVVSLARIAFNPDSFEPSRAFVCESGVCNSSRANRCPWYDWGLNRCRRIRFDMKRR